ncbi:HET-domain-containing protein [Annulohypoxylon stygium]|nr:HET-domain-containing protein [Annulohypoxylon stygium]
MMITSSTDGTMSTTLCSACKTLHLDVLFSNETSPRSAGKISRYDDPNCPFCSLVSRAVDRAWGVDEKYQAGQCELLIESRSPLSVAEPGRVRHPQPRLLLATNREPPKFHHNRTPSRKVDREKKGFIIAEIESIPDNDLKVNYLPRRKIGKYIDIGLVKGWLDECQKHRHSKIRQGVRGPSLQSRFLFRLIDVDKECIVEKYEECDYVALSYVWGDLPMLGNKNNDKDEIPILMTLKENIKDMKASKSLSKSRLESPSTGRIPQTIRDAMEFTRQIGERYLWVDTLCIIQDEEEDRKQTITRMGDIYNSAVVTIIAAAGDNPDAGLCGIHPRAGRPAKEVEIISSSGRTVLNLSLCLSSLCEEVRRSTWNTRGWTFQEQSLSQRCLYFTPDEIFFNCSECQRREGYDYKEKRKTASGVVEISVRTGPPSWNTNLRYDLDPTPYSYLGGASGGKLDAQTYEIAVQEYSQKDLRDPLDIFNAFEGIFNRLQSSGNSPSKKLSICQAQAIPSHLLYRALLWFPLPGAEKRQACEPIKLGTILKIMKRRKNQNEQLPLGSWSWASWTGLVEFVFEDNLWLPRMISRVPVKRVPLYVPIVCWYYGGSKNMFWTMDVWRSACKILDLNATDHDSEFTRTREYLERRVGIDVKKLLDESRRRGVKVRDTLRCGELGFFAAYVPAQQFEIEPGNLVRGLRVSDHKGEFRFDSEYETVDELVPIVAADTLAVPPNTQSIFLGLTTRKGISKRIGLGFVHYLDEGFRKPQWKYKFFRVG